MGGCTAHFSKIQELRNPHAHATRQFAFSKNSVKAITQQLEKDLDMLIHDFARWHDQLLNEPGGAPSALTINRLAFMWTVATILNLLR